MAYLSVHDILAGLFVPGCILFLFLHLFNLSHHHFISSNPRNWRFPISKIFYLAGFALFCLETLLSFWVFQVELDAVKNEYANAQLECNAADERAKLLASEFIGLEEKEKTV